MLNDVDMIEDFLKDDSEDIFPVLSKGQVICKHSETREPVTLSMPQKRIQLLSIFVANKRNTFSREYLLNRLDFTLDVSDRYIK